MCLPSTPAWVARDGSSVTHEAEGLTSIEREALDKSMEWAALEALVLSEYIARARMHLSAPLIPSDEVTWLAQMQHYAIPTRLLDFTYSPFVCPLLCHTRWASGIWQNEVAAKMRRLTDTANEQNLERLQSLLASESA